MLRVTPRHPCVFARSAAEYGRQRAPGEVVHFGLRRVPCLSSGCHRVLRATPRPLCVVTRFAVEHGQPGTPGNATHSDVVA